MRPRGDMVSSPVTRNVGHADRHSPHCTHVFSSSASIPRSISDPSAIHQTPGSRPGLRRPVGSKFAFIRRWISAHRSGESTRRLAAARRTRGRPRSPRRTTRCRARRRCAARPATATTAAAGSGGGPLTSSNVAEPTPASTARRRCRRRALRDAPTSWCRPTGRHSAAAARRGRRTDRRRSTASHTLGRRDRVGPQDHLGEQAQRAERTDHQPGQVEAGDVLHRRAAAVDDPSLGRHVPDLQHATTGASRGRARRCRSRRRRARRRRCRRARRAACVDPWSPARRAARRPWSRRAPARSSPRARTTRCRPAPRSRACPAPGHRRAPSGCRRRAPRPGRPHRPSSANATQRGVVVDQRRPSSPHPGRHAAQRLDVGTAVTDRQHLARVRPAQSGRTPDADRSWWSRSSSLNMRDMYACFSTPMPCSPDSTPPASSDAVMISAPAAWTRSSTPGSRPSNSSSGWRLPSPAWKTFITISSCRSAIS